MRRLPFALPLLLVALSVAPAPARADEGMWPFNRFPSDLMKKTRGWAPDAAWLERVRLASLRLGGGCSASFVSTAGLVATNHHCARRCVEDLSTAKKDLAKAGFYAERLEDERTCPALELNQLIAIEEVTPQVTNATKGLAGEKFIAAQRAEMSRLEKACTKPGERECVVVSLYHGGRYDLYQYKKYDDVRLVFAPEEAVAFFGGDPDNFMFPRYNLDVAFLRAYDKGRPVTVTSTLRWSTQAPKPEDLILVPGHPGSTERLKTIEQLRYERDVALPAALKRLAELRGVLTEFGRRGGEARRISQPLLFGVENSLKALTGEHAALADPAVWAKKEDEERRLRALVNANPQFRQAYGAAWDEIAAAVAELRRMRKPYAQLESGRAFQSQLFSIARALVRGAEERTKPNETRLREFRETALPTLTTRLFSKAPIYPELETLTLTFSLTKLREELGTDHPIVTQVLGKDAPETLARRLIAGTQLRDVKTRQRLWEGGAAAVGASKDPLILLARAIDPESRAVRKRYEDAVEARETKNEELIAKARFATLGTSVYPDATGTLRLNWGVVKGYEENGRTITPVTELGGAFARATGHEPFALPPSWLKGRDRLNLKTAFNFVTTNDIIGGNSGSPMINPQAELVGLVFDGNIQSLGGAYVFDESQNRAVGVTAVSITEALTKIYGTKRLVDELLGGTAAR